MPDRLDYTSLKTDNSFSWKILLVTEMLVAAWTKKFKTFQPMTPLDSSANRTKNKRVSFSNSRYLPKIHAPDEVTTAPVTSSLHCVCYSHLCCWRCQGLKEKKLKYPLNTTCKLKDVFIVVQLQICITNSQVWAIQSKSLWHQTSIQCSSVIPPLAPFQPFISIHLQFPHLSSHHRIRLGRASLWARHHNCKEEALITLISLWGNNWLIGIKTDGV